jgi:hypothetical protein
MDRRLLKLGNLPNASGFRLRNVLAEGIVVQTATERSVECQMHIGWDAGKWMQFACAKPGDDLLPFYTHLWKWEVDVSATILSGVFQGWCLSTSCAKAKTGRLSNDIHRGRNVSVTYEHAPHQYVHLYPPKGKEPEKKNDILVYWLPNFIFDGLIETSQFRKKRILDGFRFIYGKNQIVFRQIADRKEVVERLKAKTLASTITAVMEVRGTLCLNASFRTAFERSLFSLVEAMEGCRVRPVAMARYSSEGRLKSIAWRPDHAADYYPHRFLVANRPGTCSWSGFLATALPGFMKYRKKMGLPSACWQMVEARSSLCVPSSLAILLMCLENLSARYLHSQGVSMKRAPLEHKLNRTHKTLKCFPKWFRRSLGESREDIRNPLFHEGRTDEQRFQKLMEYRLQLLNACAAMLCAICDYRGPIVFADLRRGQRVMTIDEYAVS